MAKQTINIGSGELAGNGESIRSAFSKINDNFDELYANGGGGTGGTSISTSDTAPTDPELGDLWYDTVSGRTYIYYDSGWVDANPPVAGPTGPQGDPGAIGPTGPVGPAPDFSAVAEHIIPAADLTYDLGTTSSQWRSLYVGTSTVYFGGIPLRITNEGGITVNDIPVSSSGSLTVGNGNSTSVENVTEILFNGTITEIEPGLVGVTIASGTTVPSVDIESTAYKGFIARYGRVYDNSGSTELTVSKIVIFRESAYIGSGSTIHPTSSDDDFAVTGLGPSDVVAMFVLYGDTNSAKSLETLTEFVEVAVDTVLLDGGIEGQDNTIAEMRAAFYANINTLTAAAGGLVAGFQFYQNFINATTGTTTVREGSGAIFEIGDNGLGAYTPVGVQSHGTNYRVGHKILVLGTDLGGATPDNDCIITVDSITGNGEIEQWSVEGVAAGTESAVYGPVTGTNYQVGSGFVVAGVRKNEDTTLNADINSQGTGYVVGDVLTLPGSDLQGGASPDNDMTIIVTGVGNLGEIGNWNVTGTFPVVWPANSIDDGGNDQYDTANFINTDLANEISYNGGVIVDDAELQFGPGSKYVVVYDSSVFGIFATGSSATTIRTSGGSGADGSSTTDTGALQSAGVNQQNAVTELAIIQGPLTFPDGTEQTTAFSRVKSTAVGGRRIEEVTGYNQVSVTQRVTNNYTGAINATTDGYELRVARTEELDAVLVPIRDGDLNATFTLSFDNVTFREVWLSSVQETEYWFYYQNDLGQTTPQTEDDPVYLTVTTGGDSVAWWSKNELPGGSDNFRGAVIDYHAYTGDGTIIGTIHIVDDDGEEYITHTEVSSGSTDSMNNDLWIVTSEGTIRYARFDGEASTLKIHWTAKVFYGNELYD